MNRLWLLGCCFLLGCGESVSPILGCEPGSNLQPDCRFNNPEDMVPLPSASGLLVSQFGGMDGAEPGNLVLYRPPAGAIEVLFPTGTVPDDRSWGAADCPPPDVAAFSPHGIDLEQRRDGRWMLLVVNHGRRESVEFLELVETDGAASLRWRGCAAGPDQAFFNDVVARRDGGFWVTQMMPRDSQRLDMLRAALFGSEVGFVYGWDADSGFRELPGSRGPFPNGIEKSAKEDFLFINMYFGSEVRKLDLAQGRVVAAAKMPNPDNSSWSSSGELLVASHTDGLQDQLACQGLEAGSCGFTFAVMAVNPADMSSRVVYENSAGGPPMGGATIAVELSGQLYLGTHAGDRIGRISLP
jgi:hypothetical protein